MAQRRKKADLSFKELLEKYLEIKGLDIIIVLKDGEQVELYKNRKLVDDAIVTFDTDKDKIEQRIPLSKIESVDLFAA